VLARGPSELLTEERRDGLWQSFRVPIFEQIVTENGAVLAAECEAHDGCHIESDTLTWEPSSLDPYSIVYGSVRLRPRENGGPPPASRRRLRPLTGGNAMQFRLQRQP